MKATGPAVPPGRYAADLEKVTVAPDPRRGRYFLVMEAVTDQAVRLTVRQPMAATTATGPFALTDGQLGAWRKFARDLRIDATVHDPEAVVKRVEGMAGRRVTVRVTRHRHGHTCRLLPPEAAPAGVDDARAAHELLVDGRRREDAGIVAQCDACYRLREMDGWSMLGHPTIAEYLADAELGLSRTVFFERARVWDTYVERGGVDPASLVGCSWKRLVLAAGAVEDGAAEASQVTEDAKALGRRDFYDEYGPPLRESAGRTPDNEPSGPPDAPAERRERDTARFAQAAFALARACRRRAKPDQLEALLAAFDDAAGPFVEFAA